MSADLAARRIADRFALSEQIGAIRPTSILFGVVVLFGVLQAAPWVRDVNGYFGNVYFPASLLWLFLVLMTSRGPRDDARAKALLLAGSIAAAGLVGVWTSSDPDAVRIYCGVVAGPMAVFLGLQWLDDRELGSARSVMRWTLFLAVALQVGYYFAAADIQMFSPDFVFDHHADILWWTDVGSHVLANPNNASVIFCTAFAWAVAERAFGAPGRFPRTFVLTAVLGIWVTGSRGAILTAAALVLLALGLRRRSRWLLWVAATGLALIPIMSIDVTGDLSFATRNASGSVDSRWEARQAALPVVLDHPFGSGAGSAAETLRPALASVFQTGEVGATSHDPFLNWGVALGYVGLVLLVIALWATLRRGCRGGGWLTLFPLLGFLVAAESAGIDILTGSNNAWSVTLWVLLGLAWRGAIVPSQQEGQRHEVNLGEHQLELTFGEVALLRPHALALT